VIQRATQTPEYWGNAFSITEDDTEHLLNLFFEDELPRSDDELALALVRQRCQREEAAVSRELAKGALYQPKKVYEPGQRLVFPALDYVVGNVAAVRDGHNPEFGPFQVIQVQFDDKSEREFAANFPYSHWLNEASAGTLPDNMGSATLRSSEDLYNIYGAHIREKLVEALQQRLEFVYLFGRWFPAGLVADVNIGHLNLAEAVLDVAGGGPLPTERLLNDVGLPREINQRLQEFSLNYALYKDDRFDEVGPSGEVLWFLRRLEPQEVLNPSHRLMYEPIAYRPEMLDQALLRIERELDDEHSKLPAPDEPPDEVTFAVTYPHRRVGSVPLSLTIAELFPTGRTHRIRFMFEDARSGQRWPGWVVREHHYAFGLDLWYEANDVPVGGLVNLRRSEELDVVLVDLESRRPKREWVRVANVKDNRLTFEMLKRQMTCGYDELMVIGIDNWKAIDELAERQEAQRRTLADVIQDFFPQLARLSPQGTVHSKALYSAVNLVRRVPPGPLFAELVMHPSLRPVGDGYWVIRE
jgi:hypothetical protein